VVGVVPGWAGFSAGPEWQALMWSPDGRWLESWWGSTAPLPAPGFTDAEVPAVGWPGRHPCEPEDIHCHSRNRAYHWSPDSAWVVYSDWPSPTSLVADTAPRQGDVEVDPTAMVVRLARLDGTVDVELTAFAGWPGSGGPAELPSAWQRLNETHHTSLFSADNRYMAYVTSAGELWSMELATGQQFLLDTLADDGPGGSISVPAWRPVHALLGR
jgi:hypothetical protein